jgi:hypothetical protein
VLGDRNRKIAMTYTRVRNRGPSRFKAQTVESGNNALVLALLRNIALPRREHPKCDRDRDRHFS